MFLLGLLGALVGVAVWQLPTLLNWGITQFLQQQGLTSVAVQVGGADASKASIQRIDFTYQEPDTSLRVQLAEISLDYSLAKLMAGQAENLLIGKIDVKLDYQPDSQKSATPNLPSIELLLAAYDSVDPTGFSVKKAELADVSIMHNLAAEPGESGFDELALQAQIGKLENGLKVSLLTSKQQSLHLVVDKHGGWQVQFYEATPANNTADGASGFEPVFSGSVSRGDNSLVFDAVLKQGLDQSWLRLSGQAGQLSENKTDLKTDSQAEDQLIGSANYSELSLKGAVKGNEEGAGLVISSSVFVRDLTYQETSFDSANAQFEAQLTQTDGQDEPASLKVDTGHNITINKLNFAEWQAESIDVIGNTAIKLVGDESKISSEGLLVRIGSLRNESELEFSDSTLTGAFSAAIAPENWVLDLAESWAFDSKYGRYSDMEFPHGIALKSAKPLQVKGVVSASEEHELQASSQDDQSRDSNRAADSTALELGKTAIEITVPVISDKSLPQLVRIGAASLELNKATIAEGSLSASGSLEVPQLTLIDAPADLNKSVHNYTSDWHLNNLKQNFELKGDLITSRGSVQNTQRDMYIEMLSKHNLKKQRGDTELKFTEISFKGEKRLNKLLSPMVLPMKIIAGELDLTARANWSQQRGDWRTRIDLDTQLKGIGGAYNEILFSGMSGQLSLQVYPQVLSKAPHTISVDSIDLGVASTDTVVEFKLGPSQFGGLPIVELLNAQTQVLQGRMGLQPALFDLNQAQQNLTVILEDIDLSELVSLHQLEDIQATGRVTGQLPVTVRDGEFSIDDGQLQAVAPGGTLKYLADENALKANKYAETVMLALKDFNYDVLRAETQYNPDGTLILNLRLQGNNPEFEDGRPVNLNINLEQNVLKLFESLRLIEGVSDTLDKRVQDFYQQSASQ